MAVAGQPDAESLAEKIARLKVEMESPSSRQTKAKVKKIIGEAPLKTQPTPEPVKEPEIKPAKASKTKKEHHDAEWWIGTISYTIAVYLILLICVGFTMGVVALAKWIFG